MDFSFMRDFFHSSTNITYFKIIEIEERKQHQIKYLWKIKSTLIHSTKKKKITISKRLIPLILGKRRNRLYIQLEREQLENHCLVNSNVSYNRGKNENRGKVNSKVGIILVLILAQCPTLFQRGRDTIKLEESNGNFQRFYYFCPNWVGCARVSGRMRWTLRGDELWMSCCFVYWIRIDRDVTR